MIRSCSFHALRTYVFATLSHNCSGFTLIWNPTLPIADINASLGHRLDAKWQHFGTFLGVDYQVMEASKRDKGGNPEDCMLDVVSKWASNQTGTGTLPRIWKTVVEAVRSVGDGSLAETLARKYGEQ